ncbi:sigma-54 dependent transcriptional regulator [Haloferula sp. BvORR071]|uniref:sigma-54-dependent transcriptional regulator n=1 Tax=Haloferula sp. BvORR071 TaxID=1396141 RepID=UPI00272E888F|nr:sigma-54 dependent transcriptional regulator [Haloferula sp. BvORR071]
MADAPPEQTILIVDQDHDFLEWATKHLTANGLRILRCDNADNAVKVVEKTAVDVVVADIQLQPFDGLELLSRIRQTSPGTLVILTAGFPSTGQVIEATQRGAHDVLGKEALPFELRPVVESALQTADDRKTAHQPAAEMPTLDGRVKIIGISRALQDVFKIVGRVARSDAPVLVTGESGTGKELVAKAIHEYSPRRQQELIAINCGAIPENLLESELFGHEKGSFTGAIARRAGRFEQADGGTLFLDEIGDMPLSVQVKLLRVLQDGTFSRVGSNETLSGDVRIVTATNKVLSNEVAAGRFREDLYYRLNVVEIRLPPARARGGHPAARGVFPAAHHPQERHGPHPPLCRGHRRPASAPLAGQCPRAGKYHRPRLRVGLLHRTAAQRYTAGRRPGLGERCPPPIAFADSRFRARR